MSIALNLAPKPPKQVRPKKEKEKEAFLADAAPAAAGSEPAVSVGKDHRILVVDDNPVVLRAFELKLKAGGFVVTTTTDAGAVASLVEKSRTELLILDLNFPNSVTMEWSGIKVIQWVRRFPELAGIPIIVISGEDRAKYEEKSLAAGAVAFFQKPVDYKQLLSAILQALGDGPKAH